MEETFNPQEYVKDLGEDIVRDFQKAGKTTQTVAVGSARESSTKEKLQAVLPAGIGIGSGFVIDSYGNTSKQCDIILYEKDYALQFINNGDKNNAYYNCESVVAVGEVKSDADKDDVEDIIEKLATIKKLKRYNNNGYVYRKILSCTTITDNMTEVIPYNTDNEPFKQIFTFGICQNLKVKTETILSILKEKCTDKFQYFNRIISVNGSYLGYLKENNQSQNTLISSVDATKLFRIENEQYSFNYFLNDLLFFISKGLSVPLNFERYLMSTPYMNGVKETLDI